MMVQGHYPNMVELFRLVIFSNLYAHIYIYAYIYMYMQGGGAPEIVKLKITSSSMVFVPAHS